MEELDVGPTIISEVTPMAAGLGATFLIVKGYY